MKDEELGTDGNTAIETKLGIVTTNHLSLPEPAWKKLDEIKDEHNFNNRQQTVLFLIMNYEVH